MTALPPTNSPKIGPLFNNPALRPPQRSKPYDAATEKVARLEAAIKQFTREKEGISPDLWKSLQRHDIVVDQDRSPYMTTFRQETAKDLVDHFHAAVEPYIVALDPQKGTLSIEPPLKPIRFILPDLGSSSRLMQSP